MPDPYTRTRRAWAREVESCKRRRGADFDNTCPICLESLDGGYPGLATLCDHVMHADCYIMYMHSAAGARLEGRERLTNREVFDYCLERHAGTNCPVCRNELPTLHRLALAFQDKNERKYYKGLPCESAMNVDLTLRIAHYKN